MGVRVDNDLVEPRGNVPCARAPILSAAPGAPPRQLRSLLGGQFPGPPEQEIERRNRATTVNARALQPQLETTTAIFDGPLGEMGEAAVFASTQFFESMERRQVVPHISQLYMPP